MVQFLGPEIVQKVQFLGPELVKMVQQYSGPRNWPNVAISVPRSSLKIAIYGPRNGKNGVTNILGLETDQMVQFLAPETDIMCEQNYIARNLTLNRGLCFSSFCSKIQCFTMWDTCCQFIATKEFKPIRSVICMVQKTYWLFWLLESQFKNQI